MKYTDDEILNHPLYPELYKYLYHHYLLCNDKEFYKAVNNICQYLKSDIKDVLNYVKKQIIYN